MIIFSEDVEVTRELTRAMRLVARANAYYIAGLARLVDLSGLTEGDDEFDYFVRVPNDRLHEVDQGVSQLRYTVQERFGVTIDVMPIGVA